jgi:hypothetical protein
MFIEDYATHVILHETLKFNNANREVCVPPGKYLLTIGYRGHNYFFKGPSSYPWSIHRLGGARHSLIRE